EAGTADTSRVRSLELPERVVYAIDLLLRYADAGVHHFNVGVRVVRREAQGDAALLRELHGIRQQVHQYLASIRRVHPYAHTLLADVERERQLLSFRQRFDLADNVPQQVIERDRLQLDFLGSGFHPGEAQYLLD